MQFIPNHPCQICLLSIEVKKEAGKEIKLREQGGGEAERAPLRPDTQRRVLAPELSFYVSLNINSMLFYGRHRIILLN